MLSYNLFFRWPLVQMAMGGYSFLIFSAVLLLCWLFNYFKLPETKGKEIAEITALFRSDESTEN